jgi:hypothetical protein
MMMTKEGVKLLDFGLAKLTEGPSTLTAPADGASCWLVSTPGGSNSRQARIWSDAIRARRPGSTCRPYRGATRAS